MSDSGLVDSAVDSVKKGIDVFMKLRESFKLSNKTREVTRQCQHEIEQLKFKTFNESSSCKSAKGIKLEEFEKFVERLQNRFSLTDKVKDSMLDGMFATENEEMVKEFKFNDGEGNVYHGRFVTLKKGDLMDIAYAIYTLSFELSDKEIETKSLYWFLNIIPTPIEYVEVSKATQRLSDGDMDKFSQWCLVKLYNKVHEECGIEAGENQP